MNLDKIQSTMANEFWFRFHCMLHNNIGHWKAANYWLTITYDGRQPLIEDRLQLKITFNK